MLSLLSHCLQQAALAFQGLAQYCHPSEPLLPPSPGGNDLDRQVGPLYCSPPSPGQPTSHQGQELSASGSLPPQGPAQSLVWQPQTARHTFTACVHEAPASRVGETKGQPARPAAHTEHRDSGGNGAHGHEGSVNHHWGCQQDCLREGRAQLGLEAFFQPQERRGSTEGPEGQRPVQLPLVELPFAKSPSQATHTRILQGRQLGHRAIT